jgi:RNA polymerase sporulation-specific sigma factor
VACRIDDHPTRSDPVALSRLGDLELVARYQSGCEDALTAILERYRRFARSKARGYFLVGADRDDVEQEALIGLYKAARDFRPEHESSFRAFADLCITRQIITAIKAATRHKHQALNQYVSISGGRPDDDGGERPVDELLRPHHHGLDPADELVAAERLRATRARLAEVLSRFEVDVLSLYVEGRTYQEIGDQLDRHVKAIDNALQRIKRKLDLHLVEREDEEAHQELALTA